MVLLLGVDLWVVVGGFVLKVGGGFVLKVGGFVLKVGLLRRIIILIFVLLLVLFLDDDLDGSIDIDDGMGVKGYFVQVFYYWNYFQDRMVERSNIGKVDDNGLIFILEMMWRGGFESWIGWMSLFG